MQAIILAGGKGTRLRPYTTIFPKPLMPIGDCPIVEVVVRQLKANGFDDVVMAVGHLRGLLQAFFNNGKQWGLNISYSVEEKPLGTAAPLRLVERCQDDFLVINGDVLTNLRFAEFFQYHKEHGAICTIATYRKPVKIDLGVVKADKNNQLYDYVEKPTLHYGVSMGVYAFKKEVLSFIPLNEYFDFPDLIKKLIKNQQRVLQYPFHGHWLDIGRPDDYEEASERFQKHKAEFLSDA